MPDQCYHNGNFYQCVTATSVGESPTSAAAKWRLIKIPKEFRRVLAKLTYAHLLELDGQKDKSIAERGQTEPMLNDLVREAANKEGWRNRPAVQTR